MDISALWDFGDPAGSEERFRAAIAATDDGSEVGLLWTQVARAKGLQGQFAAGHEILDGIEADSPEVATRVALERGRLENSSGNPPGAVLHFRAATELAGELDGLRIDALHMLGIADAENSEIWNLKAIAEAEASNQPEGRRWLGSLYNNLGWTYFDQGRLEEALFQFQLGVAERQRGTNAQALHIARWAEARCLREMGRFKEALQLQQQLAEGPEDKYVLEELAALQGAMGEPGTF